MTGTVSLREDFRKSRVEKLTTDSCKFIIFLQKMCVHRDQESRHRTS